MLAFAALAAARTRAKPSCTRAQEGTTSVSHGFVTLRCTHTAREGGGASLDLQAPHPCATEFAFLHRELHMGFR